jgi:hypothetical protein
MLKGLSGQIRSAQAFIKTNLKQCSKRPLEVKFGTKQTKTTFKDVFADENHEKLKKLLRLETFGVPYIS